MIWGVLCRSFMLIFFDLKCDVRNYDDIGGESEWIGNIKEFWWRVMVLWLCVDMNIDSDIGSYGEFMLSGLIYNEFKLCESNLLCFVYI